MASIGLDPQGNSNRGLGNVHGQMKLMLYHPYCGPEATNQDDLLGFFF